MTNSTASAAQRTEGLTVASEGTCASAQGVGAKKDAHTPASLAALYDAHGPAAFRYLVGLLGNRSDAEDALQSAFVELAKRPALWQRVSSPKAYLLTVARRLALRRRPRPAARRLHEQDEQLLEARPPAMPDPAEVEHLQKAIATLPLEQREVLLLKAFEDMTFQEIGVVLEISANTAASRYRYALEKLRAALAVDGLSS